MKEIFFLLSVGVCSLTYGQEPTNWVTSGNSPGPGMYLGTNTATPLRIFTEGIHLASFTHSNILSSPLGGAGGDGLRIFNASNPTSSPTGILDLFTTPGNRTHVRFGQDGSLSGASGYLDIRATNFAVFRIGPNENARMGSNSYWRFGLNGSGANAARRVEIVDVNQQLRLSQQNGPGIAEFYVRPNGRLIITPSGGNTGFTDVDNLTYNPTERIDVDGSARLRNVPTGTANSILIGSVNGSSEDVNVRRLDFSGQANQVLLGNGTWGTLPSSNTASNGAWINSDNEVEWGTNALEHNTIVPMADFNVLFSTSDNSPSTVSIGGLGYSTNSRLFVDNDNLTNGAHIKSYSQNGNFISNRAGVFVVASDASNLNGVYSLARFGDNIRGVFGIGRDGNVNTTGVRGVALSVNPESKNIGGDFVGNSTSYYQNVGVRGEGDGCLKNNFGGMFYAGNTGTLSIGVYGESADPSNYAGQSFAAYWVGGVVTTGGTLWPSDSTLKENISSIDNELDSMLLMIEPVSYTYKQEGNAAQLNLREGLQFGVLAQQIEPFFPSVIKEVTHPEKYDSLGNLVSASFNYKAVDMTQLIPLMLYDLKRKNETIFNQQVQINDLNSRLTQLENCLSNLLPALCQANQLAIEQMPEQVQQELERTLNVTLTSRNNIVLNQNVPNPFAESTVITYSIPSTVQKAQIHFYDGQGKLINTVEITDRGNGQLNVFASDLSTGVYTYSLVADGKIVATKRMVKE